MTPIIHLITSLVIGYLVKPSGRKYTVIVWVVAVCSSMIDIDHLFLIGAFHNIWILFSIPLFLYGVAYFYESISRPWTVTLRFIALLLFLDNLGHLVLDTIDCTPLILFFPFDDTSFVLSGTLGIKFGDIVQLSSAQTLLMGFLAFVIIMRFVMRKAHKKSTVYQSRMMTDIMCRPKEYLSVGWCWKKWEK